MKRTILICFYIIIVILTLVSCMENRDSPMEPEVVEYAIRYEVTGISNCVAAQITYNDRGNATECIAVSSLPWYYSFTTYDPNENLYISAQNTYDTGTIITRLYIDGTKVQSTTNTNLFGIATCSGTPDM